MRLHDSWSSSRRFDRSCCRPSHGACLLKDASCYNEKQNEEAVKRFSLVLTLLKDPAFTDLNAKQDLETLATGFIDLAKAVVHTGESRGRASRTRTTAGGRPCGRSDRSATEGRPARCSRADSSADADGYRGASGGEAGDGRADRCRRAGHIGNGEGVSAPALRSNRRARRRVTGGIRRRH